MPPKKSKVKKPGGAKKPPAPGGGGSKGVRKKRPKMKQAAQAVKPNEKKKRNWWWLLLFLIPLLLLLLLIPRDDCMKTTNPVLLMECLNEKYCWYPIEKKCPVKCPLGFKKDQLGCVVSCACASRALLQGDMQFTERSIPSLLEKMTHDDDVGIKSRTFSLNEGNKEAIWDITRINGRIRVPYIFKNMRSTTNISVFEQAISQLSKHTCVDFVPRVDHGTWFIVFTNNGGCTSSVGRVVEYGQIISIGKDCENVATILHEILHALGLQHEQSRADRDAWVKIHYENIKTIWWPNLDKIGQNFTDLRTVYDVDSLLHFPGYAYAMNPNSPTITDIKIGYAIPETYQLSLMDIHKINLMYNCYIMYQDAIWSTWSLWSKPDVTCGTSTIVRFRDCMGGGKFASGCIGMSKQIQKIIVVNCATPISINQWEEWMPWKPCSKPCGNGYQWRIRSCNTTNNDRCMGSSGESQPCNTLNCPSLANWADWAPWSVCTKTCDSGTKTTFRRCRTNDGKTSTACPGSDIDTVSVITTGCNTEECDGTFAIQTDFDPPKVAQTFLLDSDSEPSSRPFTIPYKIPAHDDLCAGSDGSVVIGDFNGDGFDDILCPVSRGNFVLGHTFANRFKPVWRGRLRRCNDHKAIYAADFNRDGNDDLACIERKSGQVYVQHSTSEGIFDSAPPTLYIKNCFHGHILPVTMKNHQETGVICHTKEKVVVFNSSTDALR